MSDRSLGGFRAMGDGDGERELALGPDFIARVHGLLRGLRLYDSSNQALQSQLREFMEALGGLMSDQVSLVSLGDYFYLNGVRLKADASRIATFRAVTGEFAARELGGLRFLQGLTQGELEAFLKLFVAAKDPARAAQLAADAAAIGAIHVVPIKVGEESKATEEETTAQTPDGERGRARQVFSRAVQGAREAIVRTAQSSRPALRQARRVVQPVVDQITKDEFSIVGLTALKDHDEYTYVHCVNVAILSIRMGQLLGFSRQALANLGVAALLHDVGKIAVPAAVLGKPGPLTPDEWAHIHRHPIEGVKTICRMPALSSLMLDAMRVAFQHHLNVDRSGYPKGTGGSPLATVSRIVATADFFDAVTSHRAYRARPMTTFEALRIMVGPERHHFDPATLWALVQTVSLYPAGSLLQTESGQLVLSVSPNPSDLRRPHCRVLGRVGRPLLPPGVVLESWEPMPDNERVARVVPPEEMQVDVEAWLAA